MHKKSSEAAHKLSEEPGGVDDEQGGGMTCGGSPSPSPLLSPAPLCPNVSLATSSILRNESLASLRAKAQHYMRTQHGHGDDKSFSFEQAHTHGDV